MSHSFDSLLLFSLIVTLHITVSYMSYSATLLLVISGRRPEDWLEDEVGGETCGQVHFLQQGNSFRPRSSGNIGDRERGVRLHSSSRDESDSGQPLLRPGWLSSQLRHHRQQQPIFGSAQEREGEQLSPRKALDLGSSAIIPLCKSGLS